MSYVEYVVGMKMPNAEFRKEGFVPLIEDLKNALDRYNNHFYDKRKLIFLYANSKSISMILVYKDDEEANISFNAKDLIILSKCLSNDFDWKRFSRNENTLFYLKSINTYESDEELVEKLEHVGLASSEIDRIEKEIMMSEYYIENPLAPKNDDTEESCEISNDQCLDILKYLISTQTLGNVESQVKKKQAVHDIKDILLKFI